MYFTGDAGGSRYDWLDLAGAEETVTLNVDHDVLDICVPGPAVLLQDAHLTLGPQLGHAQLRDALLRVDLTTKQNEGRKVVKIDLLRVMFVQKFCSTLVN